MDKTVRKINRLKGCFYGLAIGDALGAAVEFKPKGSFPLVTDYRGNGPFNLLAGQWTDDTSMALALADSIKYGWSKEDQLKRYSDWYHNGKYSVNGKLFDIGNTTKDGIEKFCKCNSTVNNTGREYCGNGSIMRLAPVVIKYNDDYYDVNHDQLTAKLRESSETTHGNDLVKDCCVYMGIVIVGLIRGEEKEKVLSKEWWEDKPKIEDELHDYLFSDNEPKGTGFVLDSLYSAIWAFKTSDSFEESVLKAVNLGMDADTTGAVCGQFAGAYYGYNAIPKNLLQGLDKKEIIDSYLNPILGIT